jgi:hypothetical protein
MTKTTDEERRAPETFAVDMNAAVARTGLTIGDLCEHGDATWITTIDDDSVFLAPVAGADPTGNCVVVGWTYLGTMDFDFELPMDKHGYILEPIFDGHGNLVDFFGPGAPTELPVDASGPYPDR